LKWVSKAETQSYTPGRTPTIGKEFPIPNFSLRSKGFGQYEKHPTFTVSPDDSGLKITKLWKEKGLSIQLSLDHRQ
jgi:hypothetical protein